MTSSIQLSSSCKCLWTKASLVLLVSQQSAHSFHILPWITDSGFYSEAPKDFLPDDMCQTTEWTGWSECSTTCGKGYELRTRRFLNRMGRKKCPHVETTERRSCAGSEATCPGTPEAETRVLANPDCAVTSWSDWSPCSVSCGKSTPSIEARRSKS